MYLPASLRVLFQKQTIHDEVGIQDGGTLVSVQIQGQIEATSTLGCAFKISVPSEMTYTTGYTRASYDETNDYSTVECRSPAIANSAKKTSLKNDVSCHSSALQS